VSWRKEGALERACDFLALHKSPRFGQGEPHMLTVICYGTMTSVKFKNHHFLGLIRRFREHGA
jgi:hypothetical protein